MPKDIVHTRGFERFYFHLKKMLVLLTAVFLTNFAAGFSGDSTDTPVDIGPVMDVDTGHSINLINIEQRNTTICGDLPGCENGAFYGLRQDNTYTTFNIIILLVICILTQIATFITLLRVVYCSARKVRYHVGRQNGDIIREAENNKLRIDETYL